MKTVKNAARDSHTQPIKWVVTPLALAIVIGIAAQPAHGKADEESETSGSQSIIAANESDRKYMVLPESPPIKGFHPIKKAMQPLQNLEGLAIKLQQQIINLEGPLAYIQPSMAKLRNQITTMNTGLDSMEVQLQHMATTVKGVRADIVDLEKEIHELDGPIRALIVPVANASRPMKAVNDKLTLVLIAVILAALAIAFGTPLFGLLLYMKRYTLFPELFKSQDAHLRETKHAHIGDNKQGEREFD